MLSLQLSSMKDAARHLFLENTFDSFSLMEGSFQCAVTYTIDGRRNAAFFEEEKRDTGHTEDASSSFIAWEQLRPVCYAMIRGKKTPVSFRLIFCLSKEAASSFFHEPRLSENSQICQYLFMLHYKEGILQATSGTSFHSFSLDKESEKRFDSCMRVWLEEKEISFSEV